MAQVTFKQNMTVQLSGEMPKLNEQAPDCVLVKNDLTEFRLSELKGSKIILNIFPSIDTGVCASSVRKFNQEASKLDGTKVVCISKDLPFAQTRFCGAEGIKDVITVSAFNSKSFEDSYGLLMLDGVLKGLLARAIVVIDEDFKIVYTELVPEITQEPDYESAIAAVKK